MSGDVQPRKRKDKKKRKEDEVPLNEDVTIHVHKDGGTGGNICAKIVFFLLFSALIVLIGLIIKENQGLTELESIEAESRFSQIFEGWIDKSPDDHEHEEAFSPELDDHDEDDDHGEEEDEDHDEHFESDENIEEDTEEEQSQEVDDDEEQDVEEEDSTPRSEEEDSAPKSEEEETEEVAPSEEESALDEENEEDTEERSDEKYDDKTEELEDDAQEDEDREEKDESKEQDDADEKEETTKATSEEVIDSEIKGATEERLEERKSSKEQEDTLAEDHAEPEPAKEKESSGRATKIGIGVALLAVAYNRFFRKRRPDAPEKQEAKDLTEEKEPTPDLSRRNTIVPPPSLQEVEQDLPDIEINEEEYSEEEYSDEDSRSEHRTAREEYQELRTTYTRSLTPEGDFGVKDKHFEEEVLEDEIDEEEIEEEEEIDDDYDKYDDDEDEELLKRLEAKYGKLGRDVSVPDEPESDSDRDDYEHSNITNKGDYAIKEDIDAAQKPLDKNAAYANKMFEALLDKYPLSPRSLYGKARALDIMAEERQSNDLLKQALVYYSTVLSVPDVPDPLFVIAAERYIDRARFMGQYRKAIAANWQLVERFPENATYLNNLAVTYLTVNMIEEARSTLKRVLTKWPNNGFALVHYGFILKTTDNNLEESIEYITKGLSTRAPGVIDGRFYFHLGDAFARLGKTEEANKIYEEGVKEKVFMSKYQRSLYNVERLTGKPWWSSEDMPSYQKLFAALKENWLDIKQEGLSVLSEKGYFQDEAESLRDTGTWKQLELFARGRKYSKNCAKSPVTCGIIEKFPEASQCRRGQTKFSVMHPGTHVWPHCGPTNCRIRIHLGLKVPPKTFIRVAEETRSWKEGDIIIFDDSFEHEVWHNGSDFRLVLIVDVWHPNLTPTEKKSLSSI